MLERELEGELNRQTDEEKETHFTSGEIPILETENQEPSLLESETEEQGFLDQEVNQAESTNQEASEPRKEKDVFFPFNIKSRKALAGALALSMLGSGLFGFAGGVAADTIMTGSGLSDREVLYTSVVRNVAAGDINASRQMSVEDVASTVKNTVVEIKTQVTASNRFQGQYASGGAGSGVVISKDGYLVTNHHVISGANTITVRLADGKEYNATLVGTDSQTDLAILKIEATGLTPAILGDSSQAVVGETAVAIGNPLGQLGGSVTEGIISALDRTITMEDGTSMTLMQTDASINPGNSGGGLFNLYGELIGVVNSKSSGLDIEGIGFAIPTNTAKPIINDIISAGYVKGRVGLNVSVVDIQDAFTAMQYQVNQTGLYIAKDTSDGFKAGDRIVSIGKSPITSYASLKTELSKHTIGETVAVTVVRNNENITLDIKLKEIKPQ